jgi:hypothetical protein
MIADSIEIINPRPVSQHIAIQVKAFNGEPNY